MAKIKGQNLRLFLEGKAIACATTCNLHCAAETSDTSTKDDEDPLWAKNEVTKLNWDISGDGLVTLNGADEETYRIEGVLTVEGRNYACVDIAGDAGDVISVKKQVECDIIAVVDGKIIARGYGDLSVVLPLDKDTVTLGFSDTTTSEVRVQMFTEAYDLQNLLDLIATKQKLDCRFATSNGTSMTEEQFDGTVILTDVQVTAQNGENSTYSFQAVGVDELHDSNQ